MLDKQSSAGLLVFRNTVSATRLRLNIDLTILILYQVSDKDVRPVLCGFTEVNTTAENILARFPFDFGVFIR